MQAARESLREMKQGSTGTKSCEESMLKEMIKRDLNRMDTERSEIVIYEGDSKSNSTPINDNTAISWQMTQRILLKYNEPPKVVREKKESKIVLGLPKSCKNCTNLLYRGFSTKNCVNHY